MKLNIEIEAKNQARKAFESLSKNIEQLRKDIETITKESRHLAKDSARMNEINQRLSASYQKYGKALKNLPLVKTVKDVRLLLNAHKDLERIQKRHNKVLDMVSGKQKLAASILNKMREGYRYLNPEQKRGYVLLNKYGAALGMSIGSMSIFGKRVIQAGTSIRKFHVPLKQISASLTKQGLEVNARIGDFIKYRREMLRNGGTIQKFSRNMNRLGKDFEYQSVKMQELIKWYRRYGIRVERVIRRLQRLRKSVLGAVSAFKGWLGRGVMQLPEVFRDFGRQVFYAGVQIGTLIMAMNTLIGPFIKFQKVMADVSTMLVDNVIPQTEKFAMIVQQMALQTGLAFDDLGKSLYNILSASIAPEKAGEVMKAAGVAAIAGATDIATAAKTIVSIINTYGQAAGGLTDIINQLFGAVYKGQLRFEDLAKTLGNVLTVANMASIPFNELLAAITTVTKAGLPVDETVTSLRNTILTFSKATDKSFKSLGDLNLELDITWLRTHGLTGLLGELSKATSRRITDIFREKRELRGLLPLVENYGMFLKDAEFIGTKAMKGIGAATLAYMKQAVTLETQLKRLQRQFEYMRITIFEHLIPHLQHFLNVIKLLLEEFINLDKATRDSYVNMSMLAVLFVGIAPPVTILLFAVVNLAIGFAKIAWVIGVPLLSAIYALTKGILVLTFSMFGLSVSVASATGALSSMAASLYLYYLYFAGFTFVLAPFLAGIGLTIVAVLAFAGAVQALLHDREALINAIKEWGKWLKNLGEYINKYIKLAFLNLRLDIKEFVGDMSLMKTAALNALGPIGTAFAYFSKLVGTTDIQDIKDQIAELNKEIEDFTFAEVGEGPGEFLFRNIGDALENIRGKLGETLSWLGEEAKKAGIALLKMIPGGKWLIESVGDLENLREKLNEIIERAEGLSFEVPDIENLLIGLKKVRDAITEEIQRIEYAYKILGAETSKNINRIITDIYEYGELLWSTNNMTIASYDGILAKLEEVREYYGYLPEELQRLQNEMVNNIHYVRKKIADELLAMMADWDNWGDNVVKGVIDTAKGVQSAFSEIIFKTLKGEIYDLGDVFEKVRDIIFKAYADLASQVFTSWLLRITGVKAQMEKWGKVLSAPLQTHMGNLLREALEVNDALAKWLFITNATADAMNRAADAAERMSRALGGYPSPGGRDPAQYQTAIQEIGITGQFGEMGGVDLAKDVLKEDFSKYSKGLTKSFENISKSIDKDFALNLNEAQKELVGFNKVTKLTSKEVYDLEKVVENLQPGDILKKTTADLMDMPGTESLATATESLTEATGKQGFLGKTMSGISGWLKKLTTPTAEGGPTILGAGAGIATGAYGVYQAATRGPGGAEGAISGGMSGAMSGAMLGSVVPVIGTAVGAVVGGILGAAGGAFGGGDEDLHEAEKQAFRDWQKKAEELWITGVTVPEAYATAGWAGYERHKKEMDKFIQSMAGVADSIQSAIASGMTEGFEAPSVEVGIENLGKKIRKVMSDQFLAVITDMVTKVASKFLTPFISAIKTLEDYLVRFATDFPNVFDQVINLMFETVAASVNSFFEPLKQILSAIVSGVGTLIALTLEPVARILAGFAEIGGAILEVMVDAFEPVYQLIKIFVIDPLVDAFTWLGTFLTNLFNFVVKMITAIPKVIDLFFNPAKFWANWWNEGIRQSVSFQSQFASAQAGPISVAISYILKAIWAGLLAPLGIAITSMLVKAFMAAIGVLFAGMMAMTEIIIDALEPLFEKAYELSTLIRQIFDIYSKEMEDMIKSGFDISKSETRRMYDEVKKMFASLQNTLRTALKAGFEQGTKEAGWAVFERTMREGIYEAIVEGIVSSVVAFGLFMQAVGPYLDEIARLTVKAFFGVFDPDEWAALTKQMVGQAVSSLQTLKPFFEDMYDPIRDLYDMLHYGDIPEDFYTYVEYEPPDMSWWEQLVLTIQTFLAPWQAILDQMIGNFITLTANLLIWLVNVNIVFTKILEGLENVLQWLWQIFTDAVVAIWTVWKNIWDKFLAPWIAWLFYMWQQIYNKILRPIIAGIHYVWKFVWDTFLSPWLALVHMLFQKIWNGFVDVVIAPLYDLFLRDVVIAFIKIGGNIWNLWASIANDIIKPLFLKPLWDIFVWFYNSFVGWWLAPLSETFEKIYNQVMLPFINGLREVFDHFFGRLWDIGNLLLPNWRDLFPERWELPPLPPIDLQIPSRIDAEMSDELFNKIFPDLKEIDIDAMIALVPTTEELTAKLKGMIEQFDSYEDALEHYRGKVMDTADFMAEKFPEFTDTYDDILETVQGWVMSGNDLRAIMDSMAPSLDALITPLDNLRDTLIGIIQDLHDRYPDLVPNVPSYQMGGVVPKEGLYRLHAGEVYSPRATGQYGMQNAPGPQINITVNATIHNEYDTERVAEDLGFFIERSLSQ
jgi:TP901 family phage tail tape measure protein